jgi:hypothetical protein
MRMGVNCNLVARQTWFQRFGGYETLTRQHARSSSNKITFLEVDLCFGLRGEIFVEVGDLHSTWERARVWYDVMPLKPFLAEVYRYLANSNGGLGRTILATA